MFFSLFLTFFSIISASEIALYWGQNSAGTEQSLGNYCQNSAGDIYIISFINGFGNGSPMSMNIHGYYNTISGTSLLDAPSLGQDIQTCQKLGKKVLISLGGASGSYGFSSDEDAENVANELWNYFGGGSSSTRPFGSDVKVDGFDLDIENQLDAAQYVTLANKLHELYASDSSKTYYTTAAPQCPFPDASVGKAVAGAHFDYLFIQFYNNYCSLLGSNFNMDTWQSFAATSPNPSVKLMVGLPGASSAAGSGYATIDDVKAKYSSMTSAANFGGFMLWDASQANSNVVNGQTFVQQLESLIGGSSNDSPVSTSSTSSATSTRSSTTPTNNQASTTTSQESSPTASTTTSPSWIASISSTESASEALASSTTNSWSSSTSAWATTPGVIPSYTPGVISAAGVSSTETPSYSNTSAVYYTTVTGCITLTVDNYVASNTVGGYPSTANQATVLHSWTSVVPAASAASASSIEYNKAASSVSLSIASASTGAAVTPAAVAPVSTSAPAEATQTLTTNVNSPNGTWINTWNYNFAPSTQAAAPAVTYSGNADSTSIVYNSPEPTTTILLTSTIYERATSTIYDSSSSALSSPSAAVSTLSAYSAGASSFSKFSSSFNGSSIATTTSGIYSSWYTSK